MPLYIPWLTETIKKRGVRYLLHHYLGQFFLEKLTLEQLSIDIYEGKGSIKNLALDVDGLNDELDFIPFKFLDGCLIGEISVEVPWSSLATDACRVELNGAKFVCRLKTSTDSNRSASNHNNSSNFESSTLISRSLMTSSMQMAEDIVTREDSDDYDYHSPSSSLYTSVLNKSRSDDHQAQATGSRKDAGQMFEGLEMFAQLIDSVLRRTKLTARNTLFQIQPHPTATSSDDSDNQDSDDESTTDNRNVENSDEEEDEQTPLCNKLSSESGDEFLEPLAKSDCGNSSEDGQAIDLSSDGTVEFFIKFFRCEEIMSESNENNSSSSGNHDDEDADNNVGSRKRIGTSKMPETVTKLLTLEDVEMRIGGIPVSNLIGKHTIMIKFNGHKSEISIFSSSPLLAVINHEQLKTFFNVFDNKNLQFNVDDLESQEEKSQKLMSTEDYAKIENQLLETARTTMTSAGILQHHHHGIGDLANGYIGGSISNRLSSAYVSGKRWTDGNDLDDNDYHLPNQSVDMRENSEMRRQSFSKLDGENSTETTLNDIEAFSCELKLPGIWLCILRDGEHLPPLIKPYADSINSFDTINNYIEKHIKVPHIRFLALKVSLDITFAGINIFLGDLNISEHLYDKNSMNPTLKLFNNDSNNSTMNSARYTASIINNKDITVELLTKTRILIDPTLIDRIVYDYKLLNLAKTKSKSSEGNLDGKEANKSSDTSCKKRNNQLNLNLTIKGEEFLIELLCPIPDLTPNAYLKKTQLRPQSFLFDFKNITLTWQLDKLNLNAEQLMAFVKTQPQQSDQEAIKFIESLPNCGGGKNDLISLIIEPSPSNLDGAFTSDVDQALNECSMYDSIYVGHASESKLPKEAFQTKRKVVRASFQQQSNSDDHFGGNKTNDCDNEKIISPGDRQHLTDYLNQTVMSTKLSLNLYMPNCQVEFEDKEQLDLIYNRFGNDFVFWQPRVFSAHDKRVKSRGMRKSLRVGQKKKPLAKHFGRVSLDEEELSDDEDGDNEFLEENLKPEEDAFHSLNIDETSDFEFYDNEVTCKITIDDFSVRFNHQSCASALKQEILAENVLLGVVIDINKKPCTILSMVADNLELSTDSDIVVEGNSFGDKNSIFSMTADIKRPTKALKDIKLAIQLVNGLLNDFNTETFTRFWQSINVTDEPIEGYVAPTIVTELHIDILNTALSLVRDGARPALLTIDEIYLTSMVVQQTSQVMIRLIADEVSLYLKKNRQSLEVMKNYVCLIDSGLIDLKVKFSHDGRVEFNVMNNVITVRACQDSLSSLIKLISVLIKNSKATTETNTAGQGANFGDEMNDAKSFPTTSSRTGSYETKSSSASSQFEDEDDEIRGNCDADENNQDDDDDSIGEQSFRTSQSRKNSAATGSCDSREKRLLEDAMNDYDDQQQSPLQGKRNKSAPSERRTNNESDYGSESHPTMQTTSTTTANNYSKQKQRDPNACLLDESNPKLDDLFPSPLLPTSDDNTTLNDSPDNDYDENSFDSNSNSNKALDESGFFVIGNDDVGAGIIDKAQHEPIIRKLIDEPINIIDNYFKMTKPRTIPEMLASSLERYVLEEMTLIVNLFGGRDLDDNDEEFNEESESSKRTSLNVDDAHGGEPDMNSIENLTIRSRTNSGSVGLAGARPQNSSLNRKHFVSESAGGNFIMKNKINTTTASRSERNRRKHLSEGSYNTTGPGAGATSMEPRVRFGEGSVNLWESLDLMSSPDFLGTSSGRKADTKSQMNSDIKLAGGTWRQNDVCIQLTLTKVKLLYELGDELNSPISWRFMLFIDDIEIKDRIHASDINKMLYEYCTESMPKRNIQMLTVKNIATINPSDGCEECDLRVSLKPLRFNIDQDTLLFLIEFFTCLSKSLSKQQQFNGLTKNADTKLGAGSARVIRQEHPAQADGGGAGSASRRQQRGLSETSNSSSGRSQRGSSFSSSTSAASSSSSANQQHKQQHQAVFERQKVAPVARVESSSSSGHYSTTTTTTSPSAQEKTDETLPTHCHHSIEGEHNSGLPPGSQQPIYIKSFTFSPDVPIRLDYHAKHLDFEQGALAGILMGLAHLDHSELILRRVQAKHGMRGLDRVLLFTLNSWITDIKRNQLPSILSGVGPMHSVIQLFQGMKDLIWMPIDHYRKDKRLVRGLQRGASSFSSSTAMAAINLMNRFISIVQCTAQIAHDIVTPPNVHSTTNHHRARLLLTSSDVASSSSAHSSYKSHSSGAGTSVGSRGLDLSKEGSRGRHAIGVVGSSTGPTSTISALNQPRNFCEGVAVGFTILKEGFKDTGRNVAVGMQAEDVRSAVGELVRQIPSTLLNPIISATEGAQNVLVGIRNQIAPDARREDQEKWKRRVRGK